MSSPIIHHVSVINKDRYVTHEFYHKVLGLEFLLKTVNQDEISMMHLFFGDQTGRAGTEFSAFEMSAIPQKTFGTNALERTVFAVPSEDSLQFWLERFEAFNVFNCEIEEWQNRKYLVFEDRDGVQLALTALREGNASEHQPHIAADIPAQHAILGIDAFQSRVRYLDASVREFIRLFDLEIIEELDYHGHRTVVLGREGALFGQQLHFIEDRVRGIETQGIGSVHHLAINARSKSELLTIEEGILQKNFPYSGIKQREFFEALYFREPNRLLIEVATEQTYFEKMNVATDVYDNVPLLLPPFLEDRRNEIERLIQK